MGNRTSDGIRSTPLGLPLLRGEKEDWGDTPRPPAGTSPCTLVVFKIWDQEPS